MNCLNCASALPPTSRVCTYCGTLNDSDLHAVPFATVRPDSKRYCPHCCTQLAVINLGTGAPFYIERCPECFGLFFDNGELQGVVDRTTGTVIELNRPRIEQLLNEQFEVKPGGPYVKCPVCRQLMVRKRYGAKAGVLYDWCGNDGIWLDGGELGQIVRWVRAGGPGLDAERTTAEADSKRRSARIDALIGPSRNANGIDFEGWLVHLVDRLL